MKELFRMLSIQNFNTDKTLVEVPVNDVIKKSSLIADVKKVPAQADKRKKLEEYCKKAGYITPERLEKSIYFNAFIEFSKLERPIKKEICQQLFDSYKMDSNTLKAVEYLDFKQKVVDSFLASYWLKKNELSLHSRLFRFIGFIEAYINDDNKLNKLFANPASSFIPVNKILSLCNLEQKDKVSNTKPKKKDEPSTKKQGILNIKDDIDNLKKSVIEIKSITELNLTRRKFVHSQKKKIMGKGDEKESMETQSLLRIYKAPLTPETTEIIKNLGLDSNDFHADNLLEKINNKIAALGNTHFFQSRTKNKMLYNGGIATKPKGPKDSSPMTLTTPLSVSPQSPTVPEFDPANGILVKILGQGKLLKVEEKLKGYRIGKISQVVNIPSGSTKGLENRILEKSLSISEQENEQTQSEETSRETRENTNLSSETQKTLESDLSLQAGFNVSAQYGPTVGVQASTNFSSSISSSENTDSSYNYAKDVTERSAKKISQRQRSFVRQEMSREKEEKYNEQYQNPTSNHIVGIYQFIDEITEARLLQYDTRLLLEFMVPEPGNMLLYAAVNAPVTSDTPIPRNLLKLKKAYLFHRNI